MTENTAHERCDFCGDETRVAVSEKVGLRSRICESCATWAITELTPLQLNPQKVSTVIGTSKTRPVTIEPSETRPVDPERIRMTLGAEPSSMPSHAKRFTPVKTRNS